MEQQYQQHHTSHHGGYGGGGDMFAQVEHQPVACGFDLGPAPAFNGEWFQPALHPDPMSAIYQPLPYPDTTSNTMSHFGPSHLVEAGNAHIVPPSPAGPSSAAAAAAGPQHPQHPQHAHAHPHAHPHQHAQHAHAAPAPGSTMAVQSPGWEVLSSSEGSQSPAEEREEDVWEPEDLRRMGYLDANGSWRCRFEGCRSTRVFLRACDLRKHYRGHDKYFFCTEKPCVKAGVGFATRKDYQRHMGSHQPTIKCPHPDCGRIFSRKDNMREHFKKIHLRLRNNLFPRPCRRPRRCDTPRQPVLKAESPR